MLSERQLADLLKVFEQRMQTVTEHYLQRMGEHIRDIGNLKDSDVNRLIQYKRINANVEAIKREIARAANVSIEDVEKVFLAVAESDYRFANAIFGEDHTPRVKDNKPLERIIKAQLKVTAQEFKNLSQTTLLSDTYKNAVDVAVQTVQAGVADYSYAIRKAFKAAAQDGLRVQYPRSGMARRLDTAIRQNVLDGVRSLNQDVLNQVGKEFGADGVEISAHALCAQDHLPYQGLQFSKKEFDRLQNLLDRPFGMWNCKHTVFPILLGISEPAHSKEELQAYARNSNEEITIDGRTMSRYEWTQRQRQIETAVRYQKDISIAAKASGDMVLRREAQANINRLTAEYAKVSNAAGLYEHAERMRVAGFRRVKTAEQLKKKTEYGTIKTYSEMMANRQIVTKSDTVRKLPLDGIPDSITDLLDEHGAVVLQRRIYDYQGKASVDFDTDDHKRPKLHPTGAHKHIFDHSRKMPRGAYAPLTESDLNNNRDIIQKGVNYHEPK
jgi:hypothetical protein